MDPKVKNFLEKERQREQVEKEQLLINLGLCNDGEKDYCATYSGYYNKWDDKEKKYYHLTQKACEVTEDEYKEIVKYAKKENVQTKEKETNTAAIIVMGLGVLEIVIAFIMIPISFSEGLGEIGLSIVIGGIISGFLFVVFGKISRTLTDILNRMNS